MSSYLPMWVYKDGKLSTDSADAKLAGDVAELVVAAENGFFVLGKSSKKEVCEIPEVKEMLKGILDIKEENAKTDKLIEEALQVDPEDEETKIIKTVLKKRPAKRRRT